MKKIFTLIAVALMAVGANAQTTIFSATPTGDNWDVPGGSTEIEITSDHATITGGKMFVTNQQDAEKTMIKKQGGEMAFQHTNNNTFFKGTVEKKDRSIMNVPFVIGDKELEAQFVKEAEANGLVSLKGHRSVGGMRASIYNAMPYEGVEALVAFMKKFEKEHTEK